MVWQAHLCEGVERNSYFCNELEERLSCAAFCWKCCIIDQVVRFIQELCLKKIIAWCTSTAQGEKRPVGVKYPIFLGSKLAILFIKLSCEGSLLQNTQLKTEMSTMVTNITHKGPLTSQKIVCLFLLFSARCTRQWCRDYPLMFFCRVL